VSLPCPDDSYGIITIYVLLFYMGKEEEQETKEPHVVRNGICI
jgi:hypothetical protein